MSGCPQLSQEAIYLLHRHNRGIEGYMRLHSHDRFGALANRARLFASHPHSSRKALEIHHTATTERVSNPFFRRRP